MVNCHMQKLFFLFLFLVYSGFSTMNYQKFLSTCESPLCGFVERAFTSTFPEHLDAVSVLPIEGGFSSAQIYRVDVASQRYVMRILPTKFRIERRMAEHEGHQIGASLGIAPKVIYAGPESHVMIMDYVEGRPLTTADTKNPKIMKVVAEKLKKLHDYNLRFPFNNSQKIRTASQKLKADKGFAVFPKAYDPLYKHYMQDHKDGPGPDWVLGHGDLNLTNLLLTPEGDVLFIDWPNASMENRYIELGSLTFWGGMSLKDIHTFMGFYLGRPPTKEELDKLSWGQRRAAFYVATMWLRFVDPEAYQRTQAERANAIEERYQQSLRDIWDYHKKGEVVSIAYAAKGHGLSASLSEIRQKRMDYGLANLKAYENWPGFL